MSHYTRCARGALLGAFMTLAALEPALAQAGADAPAVGSHRPAFEPAHADLFPTGGTLSNAWADFTGNGAPDLFVGFVEGLPNRLYRNEGGVFTEVSGTMGVADTRVTRAAAWGDFNGNGRPDLLVGYTTGDGPVLRLYRNDGDRFTDATVEAGLVVDEGAVRQLAWVDVDMDDDLDLFVALRDRPNAFFRNDGGRFVDIASEVGLADARTSIGAVWFDYNGDGDLDLYIANQSGEPNALFRNDGGTFTDVAEAAGVAWGGRTPREPTHGSIRPCAGDVDGDGRLDLFLANYGPNGLFLNRGDGTFEDASKAWGVAVDGRYDSCALADVDNDGRLDVYVNGTITGGVDYPDYLFVNRGARFEDVTPGGMRELPGSHGAQWADFDGDGAVDLAAARAPADGTHVLWRNLLLAGDARRSLRVQVVDAAGGLTRPGAEVRLFAAGTSRLLGTRLVDSGSGYNSQSSGPVHFGLRVLEPVDVAIAIPTRGGRVVAHVRGIDPAHWSGRTLVLRVSQDGTVERGPAP